MSNTGNFGIGGQLTKDIVFNEFLNYWPLFITVLIGGQIGSFLNIKFLLYFYSKILFQDNNLGVLLYMLSNKDLHLYNAHLLSQAYNLKNSIWY